MSKEELLNKINECKLQLEQLKNMLVEYEQDYEALESFSSISKVKINAFEESVGNRRSRLSLLDGLLGKSNIAGKYKEFMSDMLNGTEYIKTISSINSMQTTLVTEINSLNKKICDTEEKIKTLENTIANLQFEYNNYPEEVILNE